MCVITSSIDRETENPNLIDKSAIFCYLNIKAMNFEDKIDNPIPILTELSNKKIYTVEAKIYF